MSAYEVPPEALIKAFNLTRKLNHDQNGRRVTLLGEINSKPALLTAERAAFPSDDVFIQTFAGSVSQVKNLGTNDIYHWFMALSGGEHAPPDLKLNLIWPCTEKHIRKYSPQEVRMVTETPELYANAVRPYMQRMREEGRLNWVFNILEGRAEQEDVILRHSGRSTDGQDEGFLLAPDLNWDRKTLTSLHLLAMVNRRDIWSLRDLNRTHLRWLRDMRQQVVAATVKLYADLEEDQIKLYVHYQPTYYHFHIHVVHVMCEATATQAVGKAFGLDNLISQLEHMGSDDKASMADVTLSYYLGTSHDLWNEVFLPHKSKAKGA